MCQEPTAATSGSNDGLGRCRTCKYWVVEQYSKDMECVCPKIAEDVGQTKEEAKDMLIYSYQESGWFKPGPEFGCIHHTTA